MLKKSIVFLLIFTMILTTFLVGCSPKEPAITEPNAEGEAPAPSSDNPGAGKGNVLIVGGTDLHGIFNPITYSTAYDDYIIGLIFDYPLIVQPDGSLTTEGGLLESYTISEDGLVYTFKLREGIKWHDGNDITAEDLAFTYDAIMRPDYKGRAFSDVRDIIGAVDRKEGKVDAAEGIKVIDKNTLEITVTTPKANVLNNLNIRPIPKHYYDKATADEMAALDRNPIGSGPFKMKKYEVEQYVELEPNKEYWKGVPKLDGIIYKIVARQNELSEFEIGSIDAVNFENSKENYEIIESYDHGYLVNNWNNGYAFAAFNFNNPIFQDKKVRQALVYGLNREGFVKSFFGEIGGKPGHTPISPVSWAYPETGLNEYKYDTAKAAQLLEEAGWKLENDGFRYKDGKKLAFNWKSYNEAEWSTKVTALAKENWKQIGVDCEIELMDFNSLSTLIGEPANKNKWDMYNMAWSLTEDPDMQGIFTKNAFPPGNNRGYYHNEKIEDLMEKGLLELDKAKRKEIYLELAKEFNEDLPYIFIYTRMDPWLVNNRVKNFNPSEFVKWYNNAHLIEIVE